MTRKTQYGWMALGGVVCLLGVCTLCKLRDGTRAVAQTSPGSTAPADGTMPSPLWVADVKWTSNAKDVKKTEKSETPTTAPAPVPGTADLPAFKPDDVKPPALSLAGDAPKSIADEPRPADPLPSAGPGTSGLSIPSAPEPTKAPGLLTPLPPPGDPVGSRLAGPSDPPPSVGGVPLPPPASEKKNAPVAPTSLTTEGPKDKPLAPPGKPAPASSFASDGPPTPSPASPPVPTPPAPDVPLAPPAPKPTVSVPPPTSLPGKSVPTVRGGEKEVVPMPGEPPLAPAQGPVLVYHVHAAETMKEIARRTLGNVERWVEIHKLNPRLGPDATLMAGAVVRLPGDACVQGEDIEAIKPLPVMHPKASPAKAKTVLPLTGTYAANLDDSKTMTLPPAIRDQLGDVGMVLVSPGPDQCLWLTNQAHLDRLAQRLEHSPAREADVRVFKRLYYAQTEKASLSSEGRVTVPERLVLFAGLHQEVVLVGIDDHFEVWDATRWRQYTQEKSAAARAEGHDAD